jgi:UPF0755 protein
VLIPPGTSAAEAGVRLAGAGVVRHPLVIVGVARWLRVAGRLQAGRYAFAPSQSAVDIVRALARGDGVQVRVTIPEGLTADQIVDVLAQAGVADRVPMLEMVAGGAGGLSWRAVGPPPDGRLEGYLFPETYVFAPGMASGAVLQRLVDELEVRAGPALERSARGRGMTVHEVLTIASMIEREAAVADERPVIAGVIYNRLRRGMPLQIDATVLYALGRHKPELTLRDLEIDSPYNTYRRTGLPPGPICSPGLASIRAAADPKDVPYLFYVLKPDGRHHFSRTLAEHDAAVRRYRP